MTYDNYTERNRVFGPNEIPGTLKREVYICYENTGTISIWDCDVSNSSRLLLHKQMITVKIPRNDDLTQKMVEAIENEIETLQAETHKKVTSLKQKRDALLCIESKVVNINQGI